MNSAAFLLTTLGAVSLAVLAAVAGILLDAAQHAAQAERLSSSSSSSASNDESTTTTTTPTSDSDGEPRNVREDTIYEPRLPNYSSALGLPSPAEVAAAALADWRAGEGQR